jgi:hypothetical protein
LITCHDLPFTFPTWQEFFDLLYAIRPQAADFLPASSTTVRTWIIHSFEIQKKEIKQSLLDSLSLIHFTIDLWTSPNHLALLGVVAHYTDKTGQLRLALLALRELEGVHSGENQCKVFVEVLQEYGVQHKIGFLIMDNATNNDTLMEHLENAQLDAGFRFDAVERRLR